MGTTADKLAYLEGTKAAIRDAIAARGVDVPEGTPFRGYAGKIGEISGGGGGADVPLDPEVLYQNCRPGDWLPLPEPNNDEMYLLLHVAEGTRSLLAFSAECTGSYTVECGTTESGAFVPDTTVSLASGAKYEGEFDAASSHSPTSEGMGQVVVRISGQGITSWNNKTHSRSSSHSNWNIVDCVCRLPSCSSLKMGNYDSKLAILSLRFFAWFGENQLQDMTDMFCACYSLQAVRALDTSSVTNMYSAFYDCMSLKAIPAFDTSKVTEMSDAFINCASMTWFPAMDFRAAQSLKYTFANCYSLRGLPWLETVSCSNFESCFSYCYSLRTLPPLSMAGQPGEYGFVATFDNCFSLQKLTLVDGDYGWVGCTLCLIDSMFDHDALIELFNSLPTISLSKKLQLSNVPGAKELTEAEQQIVKDKGWGLSL